MSELPAEAVEVLYPVLTILGAVGAFILALLGTAWGGFRWLRSQVKEMAHEVAHELLAPVAERAMKADAKASKAHKRISRVRADLGLAPDHYDEFETQP